MIIIIEPSRPYVAEMELIGLSPTRHRQCSHQARGAVPYREVFCEGKNRLLCADFRTFWVPLCVNESSQIS